MLAGAALRFRREHNARAWTAWHTAYLTAYAPEKTRRFPKLDRLLARERTRQTPAQLRTMVRMWMASDRPAAGAGRP